MNMSIKRSAIVSVLTVGALLLIAIFFQQQIFTRRAQATVTNFNQRFEPNRATFTNATLTVFNYTALYMGGQEHLLDPFNYIHPPFSLDHVSLLSLDTDIIGILYVPSIDLELPVYLGASRRNLNRGLAHLTHSSFPVGGDNTHAVIAGHRRLHHAQVFGAIESLELGDEIYLINFYQTLVYSVVYTRVTPPGDVDALLIQSDRDLLSLVTQHSNGFEFFNGFNRMAGYRYVVTAQRVR